MANGVNTKLDSIIGQLDAIYSRLGVMLSNDASYSDAAGEFYANFSTLSGILQTAIGDFGEAAQGTILYELRQIASCTCSLAGGSEPAGTAPNGCDTPIPALNDHMRSAEDYPGVLFVAWDSALPQGMVLTTTNYPGLPDGVEVSLTASIAYNLWVQSSCASFRLSPGDDTTYPTNTWVSVTGPAAIAINLPDSCAAKAFMCLNPDTGFVDCVTRNGDIDTSGYNSQTNSSSHRLTADMSGLGGDTVDEFILDGTTYTFDTPNAVSTANAEGYTITWISGVVIRIWWVKTVGGFSVIELDSTTTTYTIPDFTLYWGLDNFLGGSGDLSHPFVAQICPPTPE